MLLLTRPCLGSGAWLLASHRGGSGSIPSESKWHLWWTKRHWNRFFPPRVLWSFPVNIIPPTLHTLRLRVDIRTHGRSLGTFEKLFSFSSRGELVIKVLSLFVSSWNGSARGTANPQIPKLVCHVITKSSCLNVKPDPFSHSNMTWPSVSTRSGACLATYTYVSSILQRHGSLSPVYWSNMSHR